MTAGGVELDVSCVWRLVGSGSTSGSLLCVVDLIVWPMASPLSVLLPEPSVINQMMSMKGACCYPDDRPRLGMKLQEYENGVSHCKLSE